MPKSNRFFDAAWASVNALIGCVLFGVWGGAAAGVVDALVSALRLWDQIGGVRRAELFALGAALGAGAGVAAACVTAMVAAAVTAVARRFHKAHWAPAVWAPLLLAPVLWFAAFAAFAGPKARTIPGHVLLSVALFVIGLAGCGGFALAVTHIKRGRWQWPLLALACLFALGWVNANVLPRLYPWFHTSLAIFALALGLLAAWLWPRPKRARGLVIATLVVVLAPLAVSYHALTTSRQIRFALFDKTAALSAYAKVLPLPSAKRVAVPRASTPEALAQALPTGPKRPGADVVLITIDALRPDHVGAYGYKRRTTPSLDALAAQSTRFERAYTQAPHTSFATTSMLTGKYYPTLLRLKAGEGGDPITTVLRRYGWRTAAFYPPAVFFVDGEKLASFRDSAFGFEYVKVEFLDAEGRLEQIKSYFDTVKPEHAFLWVHFFEPHEPYEQHEGFAFGSGDKDRYDSEVAYTDRAVGKLVAYLRSTRPNAVVIVSADHGEEFDEHGGRYHGSSLYEEQVRVPLLVHVPGLPPQVVNGQAELLDVAPTVLGLLDIPIPVRMKGTDLGPWLAGAPGTALPSAFAEVEDKRMVVHDQKKLICARESTVCQLFDLAADPSERRDLIDHQPAQAEVLRAQMERWLDAQGRYEVLQAPAARAALPKAIERGRLGEVEAAPELLALAAAAPATPLGEEAAQLLAVMPAQATLAPALATAAKRCKEGRTAAWLAIAAYAAGADTQPEVRSLVALTDEPSRDLAFNAALVLAERGEKLGVPVLTASLATCNGTLLCRRTIGALGKLGERAAVPALHDTMADVNARLEVVRALGQLRDPRSLPVLTKALREDKRVPVRAEAARVLALYPQTRAVLRQALGEEREPSVREAIKAAIKAPRL
ncbi:MAG: sulfatase-like hydrolase/transferase [Deltaproteobacteria bacterium]|nr:sulfatase-like hydrolase/transferase [Deltaproteobacteria bacterium]